jgi:hypothetical protein
VASTAVEEMQE